MKHSLIWLISLSACAAPRADVSFVSSSQQPVWSNGDFENASLGTMPPSGWSMTTYLNNNINGTASAPPTSFSALNLTNPGSGVAMTYAVGGANSSQADPDLGTGQSFRFPLFGGVTARVNYKDSSLIGKNKNVNLLEQTQTIALDDIDPADQQIHVRFAVAPVLEVPSHSYNQQPYYFVQLLNVTRNTTLYAAFNVAGQAGVPWKTTTSVQTGNTTQWLDWSVVDIAPGAAAIAVGDSVKLTVIASGCSLGGHFGRVYVDGVSAVIPGLFATATAASSVNAGATLTYTVNYHNGGSASAVGAHFDMTMPPQTVFASTSATGCSTPAVGSAGTLSCPLGTLPAGAIGSFTVTVNVTPSATGSVVNGNYSTGGINVATLLGPAVRTTVNGTSTVNADVVVTQTASTATANWGQTFSSGSPLYTIKIRNNSTNTQLKGTTTNVFSDVFPSTFTNVSWACNVTNVGSAPSGTATRCRDASGNANTNITGTGNISIKPRLGYNGGEVTYTVWGTVASGTGSGTLVNTASMGAPGGGVTDPNVANNSATSIVQIGAPGTLSLAKTGAALGSISSSPTGLSCTAAASCTSASASFVIGSQVLLTASPAPGGVFTGWGGACAGTGTTCALTMSASVSVTASFAAEPAAGAASNVYAYRGSGQSAASGNAFAVPLQAMVTDSAGNPKSGVTVTFAVPGAEPSATLSTTSATTNASGIATIATTTAGSDAGVYAVTATISGGASASFALTNVGPAADILYVSGGNASDPQLTPTGAAFTGALVARVVDAAGSPRAGALVSFTVTPSGGASATLSSATATSDSDGLVSINATANGVVGAYTVDATVAGHTTTFTLQNVSTGPAALYIVSGDNQSTSTSSAFGSPLVVVVADSAGNSLQNVTVSFAATGASGTLSASSVVTDSSGLASITATAGAAGGTMYVTASVSGVPTSVVFTLSIDGGQNIDVSAGSGQSATVGATFPVRLQAIVTDVNGNAVSNAVVTFTAPGTGATATFSSATATTNVSGIAAVTGYAGTSVGDYEVTASTPNALYPASFFLSNTVGAAATINVLSGGGQTANVGDAFGTPLLVSVTDTYGNPVSGVSVSFSSPLTGATASLSSAAATNASGQSSVTATAAGLAGSYCVTVSSAGLTSKTICLSNTCADDTHCASDNYCATGSCVAKKGNGISCGGANECSSGVCALDGSCGYPNAEGPCASAVVCRSGACGSDNLCGYPDEQGSCTPLDATTCRSNSCSTTNVCQPAGGCLVHADCPVAQYCAQLSCHDDLANGVGMPVACTTNAGAAICESGVCDSDDTCGYRNGQGPCADGSTCRSGACDGDGLCGYRDGQGVCNAGNASTICRGGACSDNAFECMPSGGCVVDADCGPSQWCNAFACVSLLANDQPVPSGRTADVCASGVADADDRCGYADGSGPCGDGLVCRSGDCSASGVCVTAGGCLVDDDCDTATQYCGGDHACRAKEPNGSSCARAAACVSAICESGTCGHANGVGPCTLGSAGLVCISSNCSANASLCVPAGGCAMDADCASNEYCASYVCTPKLPNGQACSSAVQCVSAVCEDDGLCGRANGNGTCASDSSVCRSTVCSASDVCVAPGACAVDSDCAPTQFCDASVCSAKLANDVLVAGGLCSSEQASRVCTSGVCDPEDNRCGHALTRDGCTSTDQCRSGVCDAGTCVECVDDGSCGGTQPVCDTASRTCVRCLSDRDCAGATPLCDTAARQCVASPELPAVEPPPSAQCLSDAECGTASYCGDAAACESKGEAGQTCSAANQCLSGACSELGQCVSPLANLEPGGNGFGRGCSAGSPTWWFLCGLVLLARFRRPR